MFSSRRIQFVEEDVETLISLYSKLLVRVEALENPVSPAKAPKKRGRPAKRPEYDPEFFEKEVLKPAKKVTTKKK